MIRWKFLLRFGNVVILFVLLVCRLSFANADGYVNRSAQLLLLRGRQNHIVLYDCTGSYVNVQMYYKAFILYSLTVHCGNPFNHIAN